MKKWLYSRWAGIGAAGVGILMMCYGIFRGEAGIVFTKAIHICMECIGIG